MTTPQSNLAMIITFQVFKSLKRIWAAPGVLLSVHGSKDSDYPHVGVQLCTENPAEPDYFKMES